MQGQRPGRIEGLCGSALVVVAHPDDETLWAGGLILMNPACKWTIMALCRASDPDRAPRFARAVARLGGRSAMADLDDGPDQAPLPDATVRDAVRALAPDEGFDLVLTHSPHGEYTRHRRHEEVGRAVAFVWQSAALRADALWMFAYDDGGGRYMPRPAARAHRAMDLPARIREAKRNIITDVYGFGEDSFEARAAPTREAFWCLGCPEAYDRWQAEER